MARARPQRVVSQVLNSASSAVFSLGIVATTDDAELGSIAIQMTALPVALGFARTTIHEGVLFKIDADRRHLVAWAPAAVGLFAGFAAAILTVAIGAVIEGGLTATTAAIAVASFAVVAFDGLRFSAFAIDRDRAAAIGDAIWLAGILGLAAFWAVRDGLGPTQVAWSYAVAAVLGSVAFVRVVPLLHHTPLPRELRGEIRFGLDFVLQVIPGQAALIVGSLVSGLAAVGVIRASVTLYSPLATLVYAARIVLIDRADRRSLRRVEVTYAGIAAAYVTLLVVAFAGANGSFERIFGALPLAVLALVGLSELFRHVVQAAIDRSRVLGLFRRIVAIRAVQATLLVGLSAALGAVADESGLAWARVLAFGVPLVIAYGYAGRRQLVEPS